MKHNTMKRVLAATLSVLTVAAPMTANVGGILQEFAIVANAVEVTEVEFDFVAGTGVQTIQVDDDVTSARFITGKKVTIDPGQKVTVVSKYRLSFTGVVATETGSNGAYTYKFTVPTQFEQAQENKGVITATDKTCTLVSVDNGLAPNIKVYTDEEKEENLKGFNAVNELSDLKQGQKFVIVSDKPFKLVTQLGEAAEDITTATGVWNDTKSRYELTSYYAETDKENTVIQLETVAHVHQLTYKQPVTNELRATCVAPERDVTDGLAAGVYGFYKDKVTIPAVEEGQDPVEIDGDVILKNGGKRTYDENMGVTVVLDRNKDLLGTGGNPTAADQTIEFKYEVKRNGKTIDDAVGANGQIMRDVDDADNDNYGNNKFTRDIYDNDTDTAIGNKTYAAKFKDYSPATRTGALKLFTATDQGHYEVTITLWSQDNEAEAVKLTYAFDIETQELTPADFDLFSNETDKIAKIDLDTVADAANAWNQFVAKQDVTAHDFAEFYDNDDKIWNIVVPTEKVKGVDGAKYYDPANGTDSFSVTARLTEEAKELFGDLTFGDAEAGYQIVSQQIGTDLYTPYSIVVEVYNQNYGGSPEDPVTVEIKWQLVEPDALPHLRFTNEYKRGTQTIEGTDAENEASIRAFIDKGVDSFKVDPEKIDYAYIPESFWDTKRELLPLDALVPGVPTEEGRYRVYLTYNGEIVQIGDVDECIYVSIDKSKYKFDFDETLQTIVYGDAVKLNNYSVLDYLGNEANIEWDEDDFTYQVYPAALEDGNLMRGYNHLYNEDKKTPGLLNVGYYYVEVKGTFGEGRQQENIGADGFFVNVVPKEMTPSMVYQPSLVKQYDGKTKYIWNVYSDKMEDRLYAQDAFWYVDENGDEQQMTNIVELAAVGGTSSAAKKGTYNVQVAKRTAQELNILFDFSTLLTTDGQKYYNNYYNKVLNPYFHSSQDMEEIVGVHHNFSCVDAEPADDRVESVKKWNFSRTLEAINNYVADHPNATWNDVMENAEVAHVGREDAVFGDKVGVDVDYYTVKVSDVINWLQKEGNERLVPQQQNAAPNYTIKNRKMNVTWYVVGENDGPQFVNFKAKDQDADATYAKLFNGGKIHVAVKRDKLADGTVAKAKAFGLIYDKEGNIPAPKNENDLVAKIQAEAALVWGGDYPASGMNLTGDKQTKLTYGANLTPVNVETGIWARPYYVDEKNVPHYGDAMYFDLVDVTQAELNLRVPGMNGASGVTRAKVANAAQGDATREENVTDAEANANLDYQYIDKYENKYNVGPYEAVKKDGSFDRRKYFIVAVKNTLDAFQDPNDASMSRPKLNPERFGFVYDKEGRVAAPADPEHVTNAELAAASADLIVDNNSKCNTHSSASASSLKYHGENACGANINPSDTMKGVWVRPYVDFGNGLVVYADPIYFESFNDYYMTEYDVNFDAFTDQNVSDNQNQESYNTAIRTFVERGSEKFEFLTAPAVKANYAAGKWYTGEAGGEGNPHVLSYKTVGIIADKTDSISDFNKLTLAAVDKKNVFAEQADKADVEGYEKPHKGVFGASLLKVSNEVNVRPYIVIDDDLTLYGPVHTVKYDDVKTTPVDRWVPQN